VWDPKKREARRGGVKKSPERNEPKKGTVIVESRGTDGPNRGKKCYFLSWPCEMEGSETQQHTNGNLTEGKNLESLSKKKKRRTGIYTK